MSNENHSQFEDFLAQAAEPEEFEGGQNEQLNDPSLSLKTGLENLFLKYSRIIEKQLKEGLIEKEKAEELTSRIDQLSLRDIGYEASKGVPLEMAKEIMGSNMCFGPDEVRKAGIEIKEEIPPIPFSSAELKRAQELGQMLIYHASTTMKKLEHDVGPKLEIENKGPVFYDPDWLEEDDYYKTESIEPGWVLVLKELTPGSTNKNYIDQTELLAEYLVNEVFQGRPLPSKYQVAVNKFNTDKETIRQFIHSPNKDELEEAEDLLIDLDVNYLFRQRPVEVVYDNLVYFQNTGGRLRGDNCVWTSALGDGNGMICVYVDSDASSSFIEEEIDNCSHDVGVAFCRRGSDLKL